MEGRLKTAEIKLLLKECVEDGNVHPIDDFKRYIAGKTGKPYSIGQLSGSIAQLAALGVLENVDRGLYRKGNSNDRGTDKKDQSAMDYENRKDYQNKTNEHNEVKQDNETKQANETRQDNEMWRNVKIFLTGAEKELADIVGSANVWNLSSREFELLREVKELGERMNAIAARC